MSAEEQGKPSPEMAALAAQAAALDREAGQGASVGMGAPDAPGTALAVQDERAQVKGQIGLLLTIAAGLGATLRPKLAEVWTPAAIDAVAEKAAAVAMKRGWALKILGGFEDEAALLFVVLPLVGPTWAAVQPEREEKPVDGERVDDPKPAAAAPPDTGGESQPATEDEVLRRSVTVPVKK